MTLFWYGLIIGALMPSFGIYIVYKRNENLRRQLRELLNPKE